VLAGGGGALLREKMVEVVSDKFICIVDESKLSKVGSAHCLTLVHC
jgi:ribose 5-phosphate isomerase A